MPPFVVSRLTPALLATALMLLLSAPAARALPEGQPPVRSYTPDLQVFPQNFAIATDAVSRVFVGNTDGVLIFDGATWRLVPTHNGDLVRSLRFDPASGRIYVGGYDAFGYLEQQPSGEFAYHDLTVEFDLEAQREPFADIWRIAVTPTDVWFIALHHAFRWEPATGRTDRFYHAGRFGESAWFRGRLLLQFRDEGLRSWENGAWQPVPGPEDLGQLLADMVPIDDERLLLISNEGPCYLYDGRRFLPQPAIDALPHRGSAITALLLDHRTLAIATQVGQLVLHDLITERSRAVAVGTGFLAGLARTPAGDLLVVDNLGFHNVTWPAPWRLIHQGLTGDVHRLVAAGDAVYALTSGGALVSRPGTAGFERLPWTGYEAWDLLPLEDGTMLFADSYQIIHLDANGERLAIVEEPTTARVFARSQLDPSIVYVGTELGVEVLQRLGGNWQVVMRSDDMDALRVTEMIEIGPDELLIGSERGGIRRVRFRRGAIWSLTERRLDDDAGLDYGAGERRDSGHLARWEDDAIVASTAAGWFRWNGEQFVPEPLHGAASVLPSGELFALASAPDGQHFAYTWNRLFRHADGWVEEDLSGIRQGALHTIAFAEGRVLVGALAALLTFNGHDAPPRATPAPPVTLLSATIPPRVGDATGGHLPLAAPRMRSGAGRLTVRFTAIDLRNPQAMRYRTRLLPREREFGSWSRTRQQSFVDLPPGRYRFEVQAQDGALRSSSMTVPLLVEPALLETTAARLVIASVGLVLLGQAFLWFAARRSRQLAADRDRLESMVQERTRALHAANQQLMEMAHLDGLTQIPNRRRLDEYLNSVRRQCVERERVMSLAIIDVDYFKQYNDSRGHQAGDELLVALAKILSGCLRRAEDLVARYGGEEFIVVLPGADGEAAHAVLEEMRRTVAAAGLGVTISAGLYTVTPTARSTTSDMIDAADEALYRAKREGRDRVVDHDDA